MKETNRKGLILCDFIYMKCPKQAHIERQKLAYEEPGAGGMEEWGVTGSGYFFG